MSSRSPALRAAFEEVTGRAPEVVAVAPGRVNLIGEHTDYNDGFVLPVALPLVVRIAAAVRADGRLRLHTRQPPDPVRDPAAAGAAGPVEVDLAGLEPGAVPGWGAYVAGVAWALARAGHKVRGADLVVDGDVPSGAGLSSSAALECATGAALVALSGLTIEPTELALIAKRAENDFVGVPSGVMDQLASMLGTAGHALFIDTRSLAIRPVPFDLAAYGLALLVTDTRAPHSLTDGAYAERRGACEQAATALGVRALRDLEVARLSDPDMAALDPVVHRRVRHVVTENARVLEVVSLLSDGDPRAAGPLLTASHVSLRDDYEVSSDELDVAVDTALAQGALGARMTGAGFGGSTIALVAAERADAVAAEIAAAFERRGWRAPTSFQAVASAGAHLETVPQWVFPSG